MTEQAMVDKCQKVILSCKTEAQLKVAIKYAQLASKRISSRCGVEDHIKRVCFFERNIGYALGQINS